LEAIDTTRTIKRPMELASFTRQLTRAEKPETEFAATGQRYDRVLADIGRPARGVQGHVD
jgi:hypothetical protein